MAAEAGSSAIPSSPSRNSLYDATATIDDLTRSLSNFSRVATPDLPVDEAPDSDYTRAWLAVKSKLESRLVLSAEVGQALLQRHEALVRKVQRDRETKREPSIDESSIDELQEFDDEPRSRVELEARIAELVQENAVLEKRLNQALLNAEVTEAASKDLLEEVQELRSTVNRLNTEHARSAGWETRLRHAIQERDHFRQERDSESQRARVAENRLVVLGDKNAELRAQIRDLTDSLDQNYRQRQELSEEILNEARSRLAKLHATKHSASIADNEEISTIIESLVADNEVLVQSNTELQGMLADTKEELHVLQEEAEEHRAATSFSYHDDTLYSSRPPSRVHRGLGSRMTYGTAPDPTSPLSSAFSLRRGHKHQRSSSIEISRRNFEPLTPQTGLRSLSPDPFDAPERSLQPMALLTSEDHTPVNEERASGIARTSPKRQRSSINQHHRAVQTDDWTGTFFPSGASQTFSDFSSSISPNDGMSESSSLADNPSTLGSLLDRISQLFNRMVQSDALTLTTRLKRQNIAGADVSYLSRTSVESIVSDVANLRGALRSALEDDKFTTVCTRKDLRVILKLFRDMFRELGSLRIILNDIVLDPSLAPKVSDMVFHPARAEEQQAAAAKAAAATGSGWMAPLSKLFGGTNNGPEPARYLSAPGLGRPSSRAMPRPAPKAPAAPSASTTTVNVEFTGTSARAITESITRPSGPTIPQNNVSAAIASPTPNRQVSSSIMGIFAGAPRADPNADPWIVVKAASKLRPKTPAGGQPAQPHLTRSKDDDRMQRQVSRNVDAMLDADEAQSGTNGQLLERTLRPRGLSDSSIRSTFTQHGEAPPVPQPPSAGPPGRQTVFQALTQRVSAAVASAASLESGPSMLGQASLYRKAGSGGTLPRAISPQLARLLPDTSWGAASEDMQAEQDAYTEGFRARQDAGIPWMRGSRAREI